MKIFFKHNPPILVGSYLDKPTCEEGPLHLLVSLNQPTSCHLVSFGQCYFLEKHLLHFFYYYIFSQLYTLVKKRLKNNNNEKEHSWAFCPQTLCMDPTRSILRYCMCIGWVLGFMEQSSLILVSIEI